MIKAWRDIAIPHQDVLRGTFKQSEFAADKFAADFLIPDKYNEQIMAVTSQAGIKKIAKELGISPGIVVGRYQHLTQRWMDYKKLILPLK